MGAGMLTGEAGETLSRPLGLCTGAGSGADPSPTIHRLVKRPPVDTRTYCRRRVTVCLHRGFDGSAVDVIGTGRAGDGRRPG